MKFIIQIKRMFCVVAALAWSGVAALAGTLTTQEVNQIESAFGITLTAQEKTDLGHIVKPDTVEAWRSDAQARIDAHRMADLDIRVVDSLGNPVQGAQVAVKLNKNAFKFGGVATAADVTDGNSNLSAEGQSAAYWKNFTSNMFNSVGCNNAFKPKITSQHSDLPAFMDWATNNNIDVRAHLLMWPGGGTTNDLGGVAGVDYGSHLSTAGTSAYASYDVLGAVSNYAASAQGPSDKAALKATVDAEIAEWASEWNVYEWDVINETRGNFLLQQILGYDQEAAWFNIASNNLVDPDTKLFINENQVISAQSASLNTLYYPLRRDIYFDTIDRLVASNAPIHGIGFQNRYKWEHIPPTNIYSRLDDFGSRYGLPLAGTEFEVKHIEGTFTPSDYTRAQMTEETMTVYYSHELATGLNAWDYMAASPSASPATADGTNEWKSAMAWYDGTVKLNALAWYYVHRIRYNTDAELASGLNGQTGLRAFKGDYDITVSYNGEAVTSSLSLTNSGSVVIALSSGVAEPDSAVVDAWNYAGLTNGAGLAEGISTGLVGGVAFGNDALASIQNEAVRWESDGVDPSLFQGRNASSYDGAGSGLFQLSVDYLDGDFSATAALTNGIGRVGFGVRDDPAGAKNDATFRVVFNSGGGSNALYRLEATDALGNNQNIGTFPGTTLDHLNVRAVYDLDNAGAAGSFKVYTRHDGGSEVEAHDGQLPSGFNLDQLRMVAQTYNGGANWAPGDRIYTDNLALLKLGELPAPFFTVDPISKPDAAQDADYLGQTIAGTASNAVTYAKVAGPSWLSIASDGTLSGTPAGTDVGQNSWIVEASNGFDTDTAVLKINITGAGGGGPGGNISIAYQSASVADAAGTDDTTFTDISVLEGDMVAISTAPNKKFATNPLALVWSGTEGGDGHTTTVKPGDLDGRTTYVFYTQIINAGTYTFTVDGNGTGLTARSKLFVLRANSGIIEVGDTATLSSNTSTPGLSYDFSPESLPASAIAIESFASKSGGTLTPDGNYIEDYDVATRHIVHSTNVTGASWSKTHTNSNGAQNFSGAGAVFYEKTSGAANTPPTFGSDPIIESGAVVDTAYTGSTLDDHASDVDLDPMTFQKVSGPLWLTVDPNNGNLGGTPLAGDLGTNSWKVSVSDGTATNFATLEIIVNAPLPPSVSPQNGTNILFIAIDDLNPVLGCYGDTLAISPNIDALATSGVTFLNAHSQWSVCGPSRASLMTGIMPEETGVMGFKKMRGDADNSSRVNAVKRPNVVTIPQYFRYNGYRTAGVGKINDNRCVGSMDTTTLKVADDGAAVDDPPSWGDPVDPNVLPGDFFSNSSFVQAAAGWAPAGKPSVATTNAPDSIFTDGIICDEGISLMQNLASGDTQFFLGVGFKKPHLAFVAPQTYWDMHTNTAFAVAEFQQHPLHEVPYTWNYAKELASYDEFYDPIGDPGGTGISCTNIPAWKQKELLHGYYACVSFIDAQVGRLLDELETQGLRNNTIVVLWGDHGFHLGDHAEWAKHTNLERASRVPFIIHNPFSGPSGVQSGTPVALMDIYPTLCEMAGLPVPQQPLAEDEGAFDPAAGRSLKGKSLAGVVNGTESSVRTGAVNLFSRDGHKGYAYRTDRYRYTEWVANAANVVAARELYDLELDPRQTVNLAGEPGYEALMYQFSESMRYEFDQMKLSAGDIAAPELQGSPALDTTGGDYSLPGIESAVTGSGMDISWADADGWLYNVMTKTNLMDAAWAIDQAGVPGDTASIATTNPAAFFRIELDATP